MKQNKKISRQSLYEQKPRSFILGIPVTIWLILIVIIPVFLMFIMSFKQKSGYDIINVFTFNNYLEFFKNGIYWRLMLKSFRMAFIVSTAAIITGYPMAYFISRRLRKFRNFFYMLIITPLWVSYLVRIIAWKTILGNKGLINLALMKLGITSEPISIFLYNQVSVVITLTYIAIPFAFISLYTSLEKIPNNLIDAARDLGASEFNTFLNVIFPLSLPGLITGFMLSFIIALGDYIIPSQLGGNSGIMYGNVVWAQFGQSYNWPLGSALGFILFFIAAIVLVIAQVFGSREGIFAE